MKWKLSLRDGRSDNLYQIESYGDRFVVRKVRVGFFSDDTTRIGETRSLDQAIALVKGLTGCEKMDLKPW